MTLVELYEIIFESPENSDSVQKFLASAKELDWHDYVRALLRQHNLKDREQALFGNSTDEISDIYYFDKESKDEYFKSDEENEKESLDSPDSSYNRISSIYHLYSLFDGFYNSHDQGITRWINLYFGSTGETKKILALIDTHFESNYVSYTWNIYGDPFASILEQYPIDLPGWQKLILADPKSENVFLFWIAPLIQSVAKSVPESLESAAILYSRIHAENWSFKALEAFMIMAILLKKDSNFINELNDHNFKILSASANQIQKTLNHLAGDRNLQERFIGRLDSTLLNKLNFIELITIGKSFVDEMQVPFLNVVGIQAIMGIILGQNLDNRFATLSHFINQFYKSDIEKLTFLNSIPQKSLTNCISSYFELAGVLALIPVGDRYEFSQNQIGKELISKLKWNPYTLARVVNVFPEERRVEWLKSNFSPEELLKIKTGESRHHWKQSFKHKIPAVQRNSLNQYMYSPDALSTHNVIKAIKRDINNIHWVPGPTVFDQVSPQDYPTYTHTNLPGGQNIVAPPPIMAQRNVLFAIYKGEVSESDGLKQIKEIGHQMQVALSNANNPHCLFYKGEAKKYFDAFVDDASFEMKFKK